MQQQEPVAPPDKPPKMELGNNSLLVIALIVTVCSGREQHGTNQTQNEIQELRVTLERIEKKVDKLSAALPPPAVPDAATNTGPQ